MEPVTVEVKLPLTLRRLTGGASTVTAAGETVADVIEELGRRHAGFRERVLDGDGRLLTNMHVYLNGDDVRYRDGLATRLSAGDRLQIIPAAAGG